MAKFIILVTSPYFDSNAAYTASKFANAALDAEHQVSLFFYGAGVSHANKFNLPQAGEPNAMALWEALSKRKVELLVCATAAGRRALIDDQEAAKLDMPSGSINPIFSLSGLTELAALTATANRVIQF